MGSKSQHEDNKGSKNTVFRPLPGDEVVISGISGVFPKSDSIKDFMDNLYSGVDMVSDKHRWPINDQDLPKYLGMINGMEKFDAQFFKVAYPLALVLEPMSRKLLEHAYGAIFDAGTNLTSLKGKKIGVFIGSSFADRSAGMLFTINKRSDSIINGGSKAMLANRISYWMDGKGPSFTLDYACASSSACLEKAYSSIKSGECDAALVGGCNFCLKSTLSMNMRNAGLLCMDGKTKCFDINGDGYVRADAVSLLLLQRARDAKRNYYSLPWVAEEITFNSIFHRIYAEVYHAKGTYKMTPDAAFLPLHEPNDMCEFLEEFYSETDVEPNDVEYIEAHGSGIAKADGNEIEAIGNVFANNGSIKIGSVKSNMGNSEPASGVCSVTKACLAYHQGRLPANLHYEDPQEYIPAIRDGRVQVLTENASFDRGFIAMNNFSFTGANIHVLLKGHYKQKNPKKYQSKIPYIVLASGRQEGCVNKILDILSTQTLDPEQIGLLHNAFEYDILGHTGRGYTILDKNENNETVCLSRSANYYSGIKRPLWFVFSGMGSQWAGMGAELMKIPTFAAAIEKCRKALEPKGIDIVKVITEPDGAVFDDILNAFVGIGAVQIGLTDILKEMGIVPDHIIGHSLGEMACAYHDETFTAEQMILSTYCRGKVCLEASVIKGSMAAIGMGYKAMVNICPPEIDVACHNSCESSTISGPADAMKDFVGLLTKRGVFAKEVPCANVPYHSRYIALAVQIFGDPLKNSTLDGVIAMLESLINSHYISTMIERFANGPALQNGLRDVIKNPKQRSSKWVSTSIPEDKWDEPIAKYSSPEYHANNMLSPVLFEETAMKIPNNAIVIEIAPHGLLQAILKRSHKDCTHIPLTKRGNKDGVKFLLEAVGKMYEAGLNPKVDILYPKIEYPVSTETPLLSHFIEWEHSEDWPVTTYDTMETVTATTRNVIISIHDDDYTYLQGYMRDGLNILPEAAILVLIWETLAMYKGVDYKYQSVVFRDITFYGEVIIQSEIPLRLSIMISKGNDQFEVCQDDVRIASGIVGGVKTLKFHNEINESENSTDDIHLTSDDIYKILKTRGFSYKGQFKSIYSSNLDYENARVKWTNEWITFLDSLMQLITLARDHDGVSKPKFIRKVRISVLEQENASLAVIDGVNCYKTQMFKTHGVIRCAGVEIDNITFLDKPVLEEDPDVIETRAFYPYHLMEKIDLETALHIMMQIIDENATSKDIKITKFFTANIPGTFHLIKQAANSIPSIDREINLVRMNNADVESMIANVQIINKTNVFVFENVMGDEKKMNSLQRAISKDTFILALEQSVPKIQAITKEHFSVITSMSDGKQILILLKKTHFKNKAIYIPISYDSKFSWLSQVYGELRTTKRVVLVSERQPYCGVLGLVKKLRKDGAKNVSAIIIDDFHSPAFNPDNLIYKEQLEKELTVNILKKGQWGGYYYAPSVKSINIRNITLNNSLPGDLEQLEWVEAPIIPPSNSLVQVYYSALSMRDVQKVVSNVTTENKSLGMDFSGIDKDGERVMGMVRGGALGSTVEADPDLLWPVPEYWSLEDAATVPLPYLHAYYCLTVKGQLFKGQTVFVTGGAGALGQAVISLCLALDCTVYTTVSTVNKKKFLLKQFPTLNENNIGNSQQETFHDIVMFYSKKKGCDFVINCANGSAREAALKCVGFTGLFLDISQYDMNENNNIGMHYLESDRSYKAVNLYNIFRPENKSDKKFLQKVISEGIARGIVRPLSRLVYSLYDISRAFKLISGSQHRGRVVIRMRDPVSSSQGLNVMPRMTYSPKGVYIIVCDDSDLGILLADRLVKRGARKLVIHIKSKFVYGYLHSKFVLWSKQDVAIKLTSEKLHTEQGCMNMLKDGTKLGQIKGIFIVQHSNDTTEINNDCTRHDKYIAKFNTKIQAVSNLDKVSRNICGELSYFVILSQYSKSDSDEYTLSILETICQARNNVGAPALIMRYDNPFILGDLDESFNGLEGKLQPQSITALFNAMENSLKLQHKNVHTFNVTKEATSTSDFLKKIMKILGIKSLNDDNINDDVQVKDFKLNEMNLEEIKTAIRNTYKIDYPIENIQRMTIHSFKQIGKGHVTQNTKFDSGLEAFYTFIDNEEDDIASHPIVPMATLLATGITNNLDPEGTYLTLIPGFEGSHQIFTSVTERLKIRAVSVQLGPDMAKSSIPQFAADVRKLMKTKFETKSKFYLLGYSFGVNIALELAALLEKEGHVGVVYCLDSSPDALRVQFNAYLGNLTESQLQNKIIEHVFYLMTGNNNDKLKQNLENSETWETKVDIFLKRLRGSVNYSNEYKKSILESAYRRIILAREYQPDFKLESELVLMKGIPHPESEYLADDYNLSKHSLRPVQVYNIESDHAMAPHDCRVANIVNKFLDPKLLEDFKKQNLCETYLTLMR